MNRNTRRWRRHYRWMISTIIVITPVTPTILEPIAPGCVEYGPACVIDYMGDEPTPETVETVTYEQPYDTPLP